MKKNIPRAVRALEKVIKENWGENQPDKVKVYYYQDQGFRIAEISSTTKRGNSTGGCSYMRCECPAIILAAEQFVLTFGKKPFRPRGWKSDIDDHDDAKQQVIYQLTK